MRLASAIYQGGHPFDKMECVTSEVCVRDPADLQPGDILVVWGGADISPSLYNQPVSKFTYADAEPSNRDKIEWALMQRARNLDIPIVGVCRGAQMLCALAGGTLFQHVEKHGGFHNVETYDGRTFSTNSIHHQMMNPWKVKHEMLASVKEPRSDVHYTVDVSEPVKEEPEYVYFPDVKGHAIQWHPEGMTHTSPATQFIFEEIKCRL